MIQNSKLCLILTKTKQRTINTYFIEHPLYRHTKKTFGQQITFEILIYAINKINYINNLFEKQKLKNIEISQELKKTE